MNDYTDIIASVRKHLTIVNWNGYLLPYLDQIMAEYERWLLVHQPTTREMYETIPKEQRRGHSVWGTTWRSGSPESKVLRNILANHKPKAIADATKERKAAKWTGWPRYLTAPDGSRRARNGMRYNSLFGPNDYK